LVKAGGVAAELYYNMGNAEFKAGHLGQAVADYRRALKRAPQDEDIRYNLNYVRTFIRQPAEHAGPLARWLENAFAFLPVNGLAWGALAAFWILAVLLAVLVFTRGFPRWLRWAAAGMGLVFLVLASWGAARTLIDRNLRWGVIIASRAEARNGPNQEFQVGFVIPEGREVRVLGHEGAWVAVGLPSEGYKGWIKAEDLAEDE
jgi:tetratricopeptide (TPR) repeat protein